LTTQVIQRRIPLNQSIVVFSGLIGIIRLAAKKIQGMFIYHKLPGEQQMFFVHTQAIEQWHRKQELTLLISIVMKNEDSSQLVEIMVIREVINLYPPTIH